MAAAISLAGLTKRYGEARGIDDVSFDVPEATIFGFIGPNGAGKTTTIRILLGLIAPTSGTARIFDRDVTLGPAARASTGYVPGETDLYPRMRARELLAYLGSFHPGDHAARRHELAARFDLDLDRRTDDLSLGNRKKVAIVAALQHAPRLIVLDEPSNGLDPVIRARLHETLRDEAARGATIFFSSHELAEVQAVCRAVAVLREGRVVACGDVAALRGREVRRVRAIGIDPIELAGVTGLERDGDAITFLYDGPMPALLSALAAAAPRDVRIDEPTLEEVFLRYYAGTS
ncbi:MAG TPA: ABC transporter ATP-binding protein [Kofleriaceae bacterium]|jgi:ABC-2 type transport system ATP-binding protein|nr:ABC transporter ATP-binding protein [Kofleriaceae bacterium]